MGVIKETVVEPKKQCIIILLTFLILPFNPEITSVEEQ